MSQGLPISKQVAAVIAEAARVVAVRSGEPINPGGVHNPAAIGQVLRLLCGSGGLRQAVASAVQIDDDALALTLVAADPEVAARGAQQVHAQLAEERTARRRDERRARGAGSAQQIARETAKLASLRAARDRARVQASVASADAANLRREVKELSATIEDLSRRVEALVTQLAQERAAASEVAPLARSLAFALSAPPSADRNDPRGVGPGEPARVDPARPKRLARVDPTAALQIAARSADLPDSACESITNWLPVLLHALADPPRVSLGADLALRVEVLGGGHEIGGSCVLVMAGGTRILVDAGTRPDGQDAGSLAPPRIAQALAGRIDAVVVTHAHNDHAGWVPALLASRPNTPVFTSQATADLLATMWMDSAKILSRRSEGTESRPAYTREDAAYALSRIEALNKGERRRVGELDIELFPAGHILGAVCAVVYAGGQRIVVSGDVSGPGQRTVGGIVIPDSAVGADLLVLESTYAGMSRPMPRPRAVDLFVRDVTSILDRGGRVLVPAFALGRAQEIALLCAEYMPGTPVIIDGLAREVSRVYQSHPSPNGALMQIFNGNVRPVPHGGTQSEITMLRTGVIITTSGMLTAGPAVAWARSILPDRRSGLMVVGYQDEDSPGRRLLQLAKSGGGIFEFPGTDDSAPELVEVAARVADYKLGAHASADELITITANVAAREVMLVHGEPVGQRDLRARMALRHQATVDATEWHASLATRDIDGRR